MTTSIRAEDIISPITDTIKANKNSPKEAKNLGLFAYNKPTPENTVLLLIDHQVGLMASVRDTSSLAELKSNVLGLARTARALNIPTLITSSNAQWQNGDTLPEIKSLFPNNSIYRRTGIINAYEDPTFRRALINLLEATGRTHIIIAGVTIGTCCTFPTLSLLNDGYKVYPVIDACGAWNQYEVQAATLRMANAGAEPVTTFSLACELQADWKKPSADQMLEPFKENLSEYGFVLQNFWDNVGTPAVEDPFKIK